MTIKDLNPNLRSAEAEHFEKELRNRIIGQEEAITAVTNAYQQYLAGLTRPDQPITNIMFLGPTGTGKTRIVESMAETLYGTNKAVLKINCGEYQHSHEVAKLIGSPPGYLGHRETHPAFTQEALNAWFTDKTQISLVLFDEIEKASDALWKIMLGILDTASLSLGDGRKVNFNKSMIFMTSNVGAAEMALMAGEGFGFGQKESDVVDQKKLERTSMNSARSKFPTEFMNRIDKFITFHTLTKENITAILELELGKLQQRILDTPVPFIFSVDDKAKEQIIIEGFDPKYNARNLKRVIEDKLINPLASLVSSKQVVESNFIRIRYEDGQFKFKKAMEKVKIPLVKAVTKERAVAAAVSPKGLSQKEDVDWALLRKTIAEERQKKASNKLLSMDEYQKQLQ